MKTTEAEDIRHLSILSKKNTMFLQNLRAHYFYIVFQIVCNCQYMMYGNNNYNKIHCMTYR